MNDEMLLKDEEAKRGAVEARPVSNRLLEGGCPRMAILQIAPELLREIFCLPEGAEIVDLRVPVERMGVLEVKISGAGWPTPEGNVIMRTTGTMTKSDRCIDLGLPSNAVLSGAASEVKPRRDV